MTTFPPTAEQSAILDHTASDSSNLMINALAGCGKSDTFLHVLINALVLRSKK